MKLVKGLLALSIGAVIAAQSMSVQAKELTIGFSQIGAESEWRTANTNDVNTIKINIDTPIENLAILFKLLKYPYLIKQ